MGKYGISATFRVRESKKNKNGESAIGCVISAGGSRVYVATGRFIDVSKWDNKNQCVIGKSEEVELLNGFLNEYKNNLYRKELELIKRGYVITATLLKDAILDHVDELKNKCLMELLHEHNEEKQKLVGLSVAPATYFCFEHTERLLRDYLKQDYHREDIYLHELNIKFIQGFHTYLLTQTKMKQNTTTKHLKFLKKIVNDAVANGYIPYNKLAPYKVVREMVNEPVFLTEEELRKFINFTTQYPHLEHARDMFLFSCFTGLAYIDIKTLRAEHLEHDDQGRMWIKKKRVKTGVLSRIPVLPIAKMLLDKYRDLNPPYITPVQDASDVNKNIKSIAILCGIDKHIVFHSARHTFATTVTLSNNISLEVVSKMLGHTNTRMTTHYARLLDNCIAQQMEHINSLFGQEKEKDA